MLTMGGLTVLGRFRQKPLALLHGLSLLAITGLQPTLGRHESIVVFIGIESGQILCEAADGRCAAVFGCFVDVRYPSQGRSRCEKREELGRELVCHVVLLSGT